MLTPDRLDEIAGAQALAGFVAALRTIDPGGAPRSGRGPLAELDGVTRAAIEELAGGPEGLDAAAVREAWEQVATAPPWEGVPVWRHGDLLPPNLLVREGRLGNPEVVTNGPTPSWTG